MLIVDETSYEKEIVRLLAAWVLPAAMIDSCMTLPGEGETALILVDDYGREVVHYFRRVVSRSLGGKGAVIVVDVQGTRHRVHLWTDAGGVWHLYRVMHPTHPGEVLREEFLAPLGISQYRLAKSIHVPPRRINEIVHGKRGISADTALRLARFFGTSERFWMNLQSHYDLEVERERLGKRLDVEVQPLAP